MQEAKLSPAPTTVYCGDQYPDPAAITKSLPLMDVSSIRFHKNVSIEQSFALLDTFTRALTHDAPYPDSVARANAAAALDQWPDTARSRYEDYMTKHLTKNALIIMAFLYGVDVKSPKTAKLVAALWDRMALPMWGTYLQNWYSRFVIVKAGGIDPGADHVFNKLADTDVSEHQRSATNNDHDDHEHTNNHANDDDDNDHDDHQHTNNHDDHQHTHNFSEQQRFTNDRLRHQHHNPSNKHKHNNNNNDDDDNNDNDDHDNSDSSSSSNSSSNSSTTHKHQKPKLKRKRSPSNPTDVMRKLAKAVTALAKSNSGNKPKSGQSKKTKFLKEAQKCIDSGDFLDLELLGSRHLNKLTSSTYKDSKVKLANGLFLTSMDNDTDQGQRASQVREGMDVFLRMTRDSKKSKIQQRAPDRTLFNEKVWALPIGTFSEKAEFVKQFFAKNHDKTDWVDRMSSDNIMLRILKTDIFEKPKRSSNDNHQNNNNNNSNRYNRPSRDNNAWPRQSRDNSTWSRISRDGYRGQSQDGNQGHSRNDGSSRANNPKPKYCPTRTDKSAGRCLKGRYCLLEHRCASCDGMHAAAQCTQWDELKVAANVARR
jgi:hypothetical protein